MATLTGTTIQSTYDSLLKVTDNDSITGSLKRITDGLGNNTPLYLSSSAVEIVSALNVIGNITATNLSGTNTGDETKASIETKLGAATSSNSGYLTSTDWSTFNNKIAGTGTLNTIPKFTSSSSIGNSSISDNGTIVTINEDVNVSGGNLAIGTTTFIGRSNLSINRNITGNASSFGIINQSQIQSDVTSFGAYNVTTASTQATTFTLTNLSHYYAEQGTLGAGSTVSTQMAFQAHSSLIGATTNIGFRGQIPSGTNRWNLYMDGTANNYLAGNLGIGSVSLTQYNLRLERSITGNATSFSFYNAGIVQSDVTTTANYNATYTNTQAASFTLAGMNHYNAIQGVFGAGSTVTTQSGFRADSSLIGATNNYGFRGLIPSGTGRWNLYMDGTANNYLAGALGVGTTSLTTSSLHVGRNITGGTAMYGIQNAGIVQSDVTSFVQHYRSLARTAAASFTLGTFEHYIAEQGTIGAGSAITTQTGFLAASSIIGATNNFGFRGDIPSGTNRWNLYMAGTANNYLAGNLSIGTTATGRPLTLFAASGQNNYIEISGNGNTVGTASFAVGQGADNNAYVFNRANSALIIATNSAERARFLAGGNLLINATVDNGTGARLQVNGAISANNGMIVQGYSAAASGLNCEMGVVSGYVQYNAYNRSTSAYGQFRLDGSSLILNAGSNGNVGIGTTSPASKLDVWDYTSFLNLSSNINSEATTDNQQIGGINFRKHYGLAIGAAIRQLQAGGTTAYAQAHLAFYTQDGSIAWDTPVERMRITSGGNVGIGTSSPSRKLSVSGQTYLGGDTFVASNGGIFFSGDGSYNAGVYGRNSGLDLVLQANNSERMRITSSGNVGIGTSSPAHRLQLGDGTSTGSQYARFVHSASDIYIGQSGGTIFGFSAGTSGFILSDNASFAFGIGTTGAQPLVFGTNNNERVRINSSGKLLVGKTADDVTGATVQVSGNISFTNSFNTQISNYTLVLGDQCRIIQTDNASANTVTVPTDASVNFPVGTEIAVIQYGAGQTTIVASSGVTIRSRNSYTKIADRYTGATLVKLGVNDWYLIGNLTA